MFASIMNTHSKHR